MQHLIPIVEAKSGSIPIACDASHLRYTLGYDTAPMRSGGYDPSIVAEHEVFNDRLDVCLADPQFGEYLRTLTPLEVYAASGVRVLSLDAIRTEIQELAPGVLLFPQGYVPFATSIGGNAVCFHAPTGRVVWADHSYFLEDSIYYMDRSTGDYHSVPFTPENIELAVVFLSDDLIAFLTELLDGRLEKKLDELD
jgi:hypothetical protein